MFSTIAAVKADAAAILAGIGGLGDVHFGVGEYRDFGDAYVTKLNTPLGPSEAAASAGITTWAASGGGDFFEANLLALSEVATDTPWRAGSTRIIVWFGDAPGHDPSGASTLASTIAALGAESIIVHAIDSSSLDSLGQATAITGATGGTLTALGDPGGVAAAIEAAIDATFAEYTTVELDPVGNLPGVDVSIVPGSYVGAYDRSIERTFTFDVTFEGLVPGEHHFVINALVDGGIVAVEDDWITVSVVPLPAAFPLYGAGILLLGFLARRKAS
ncbi:MAG: hypothetical protein JKY04_09525 [Sneathiella sp.]|nr:hypothetical protein [Sneathiella sp.]